MIEIFLHCLNILELRTTAELRVRNFVQQLFHYMLSIFNQVDHHAGDKIVSINHDRQHSRNKNTLTYPEMEVFRSDVRLESWRSLYIEQSLMSLPDSPSSWCWCRSWSSGTWGASSGNTSSVTPSYWLIHISYNILLKHKKADVWFGLLDSDSKCMCQQSTAVSTTTTTKTTTTVLLDCFR